MKLTEVTVKVHLDGGGFVDGAGLAKVRETTYAGVEKYYNEPKHKRPNNGDRLHVTVEFVENPADAHMEVEVHPGKAYETDQTNWNVISDPVAPAHEIGHQLRLPDEYQSSQT